MIVPPFNSELLSLSLTDVVLAHPRVTALEYLYSSELQLTEIYITSKLPFYFFQVCERCAGLRLRFCSPMAHSFRLKISYFSENYIVSLHMFDIHHILYGLLDALRGREWSNNELG